MSKIYQGITFIAIAFIFLGNCSSKVSEDDIKRDLIGQTVSYRGWVLVLESQGWTFHDGEIDELKIINRLTNSKLGMDEVTVFIKASDKKKSKAKVQGTLILIYNKYDQGWKLENVKSKSDFDLY